MKGLNLSIEPTGRLDYDLEVNSESNIMQSLRYLMTKVPGIGGASIHSWLEFRTCRACFPGSCHRMVKHCCANEMVLGRGNNTHTSQLKRNTSTHAGLFILATRIVSLCVGANADDTIIHFSGLGRVVENTHDRCGVLRLKPEFVANRQRDRTNFSYFINEKVFRKIQRTGKKREQ
jgi:hypothetical protein